MQRPKLETTWLYTATMKCKARNLVHEGGSRSSKTTSVMQAYMTMIFDPDNQGIRLDVVRKTMPSLRATAMVDFFDLLRKHKLYNPEWHNKTEAIYRVPYLNTEVAFYGLDQAFKIKGRSRDIVFCNEANELTKEDNTQLKIRTRVALWYDYNPHDRFHWIYDEVLPRRDCQVFHSTYLDNPFLSKVLVDEIEALKDIDLEYWKIYGLGQRGVSEATIFPAWEYVDRMPKEEFNPCYGLDIGFTSPSSLVAVDIEETGEAKDNLVWDELLYERRLTDLDLVERFDDMKIVKDRPMYVDTGGGGKQTIETLIQNGYNAIAADKGPGSVEAGIRTIKSFNLKITKKSVNLTKEVRSYRYKTDRDGVVRDGDPVKVNNHAMDGGRMATYSQFKDHGGTSWLIE